MSCLTIGETRLETRAAISENLGTAQLVEEALRYDEGLLSKDGVLVVNTGCHTGRSARDKFIVKDDKTSDTIWWGETNRAMSSEYFASLRSDFFAALRDSPRLYRQQLFGGSHCEHRVAVQVITALAWHSLFIRTLLIRPSPSELSAHINDYTVIDLPEFRANPERHGCRSKTIIAVNFTEKLILIGGTAYAGEMKKSVFSILNYLLPEKAIMPMHCSANIGPSGDTAVFFGLSGTGKTTLSADSSRQLIGDDEHGWSDSAVFNFEGGCYAKLIRLSAKAEPEIYATTKRFGTVAENVVFDPKTRTLNLDDSRFTENTRGAYPLDFIPNTSADNMGPVPRNIIMLTADAFGVLPPIARLTSDQAMYHFLSGYTAKIPGTEIGISEPQATFSTCFGAPFMPRHPSVYGNLLKQRIAKSNVRCWLINTGWTGGKYGIGKRIPVKTTRVLLGAALGGKLDTVAFRRDENFGFDVPVMAPGGDGAGIDDAILDPRSTWSNPAEYDVAAQKLVQLFADNFAQFTGYVDENIRKTGPRRAILSTA